MPQQPDALVPSQVILASGERFPGFSPAWVPQTVSGEVVFNTGMVGYVECLTDPSYRGQILNFTYPLLGNYGVPDPSRFESSGIQAAAMVVDQLAECEQHHAAQQSLRAWCQAQQMPWICGVDTRALTKVLRKRGAMPGAITVAEQSAPDFPDINQQHLVQAVSIAKPIVSGSGRQRIIVVDCGMKLSILRHLQRFPVEIKRVPFDYDFSAEEYDGVLLSNGPGDPGRCVETIAIIRKILQRPQPIFGICLGAQLLSLAVGAKTYKLPFGHRAQNHPCQDLLTEKCYLTSQNHGFCVDESSLPDEWQVWFRNLNDHTVQGIRHRNRPWQAVQFHPEAGPGPVDTAWLFSDFIQQVIAHHA